jgi:hypothetical protein
MDKPKDGKWRCLACNTVWDADKVMIDPTVMGGRLICGDAFCGGSVTRVREHVLIEARPQLKDLWDRLSVEEVEKRSEIKKILNGIDAWEPGADSLERYLIEETRKWLTSLSQMLSDEEEEQLGKVRAMLKRIEDSYSYPDRGSIQAALEWFANYVKHDFLYLTTKYGLGHYHLLTVDQIVKYYREFGLKPEEEEPVKADQDYIFHVYSGLDAFEVTRGDKKFYMHYISIIAKTPEDAREQVAEFLGQKLEDQDTNADYVNFVSDHVEKISTF